MGRALRIFRAFSAPDLSFLVGPRAMPEAILVRTVGAEEPGDAGEIQGALVTGG